VALSSSPLRRSKLSKGSAKSLKNSTELTLDAGNGVRLKGELTTQAADSPNTNNKLIILFHGWEGSSKSNYVVSSAAHFFRAGYDVFRLNFRDHGNTHGLNRGIFNSSLIEEVVGALHNLQWVTQYQSYSLMGYSLGGNFALRVGLAQQSLLKPLQGIFAVCPVLDPAHTTSALEAAPFIYEQYFVRKWKISLQKKLVCFPEYRYEKPLKKMTSLREMNNFFIPRYTDFKRVSDYFKSYTITGQALSFLSSKTMILASTDDPIIPPSDFHKLAQPNNLSVTLLAKGSHCAFLRNLTGPSQADEYALEFFNSFESLTE